MITATTITIHRAEGPHALCVTTTIKGRNVWADAAAWLAAMAHTFPERGYDKHDFVVTWSDGDTYEGRLDCSRFRDLDVAAHVREHLAWLTAEPRHQLVTAEQAADAAAYLATHEIPEAA